MFVLCGNPSGLFVGVDAYIDPLGSCEFAEDFRKNGAFCRADVGIGPYNVSANPYNLANSDRKADLPQLFKGNCLQIQCPVTGGACHSARKVT